jgi:osmotically inducible lipoprotein OsmB
MKKMSTMLCAALLSVAMTGTAIAGSSEALGTVVGGIAGGMLGNNLGEGSGVATIGGAVVGGLVGNKIGNSMDQKNYHHRNYRPQYGYWHGRHHYPYGHQKCGRDGRMHHRFAYIN